MQHHAFVPSFRHFVSGNTWQSTTLSPINPHVWKSDNTANTYRHLWSQSFQELIARREKKAGRNSIRCEFFFVRKKKKIQDSRWCATCFHVFPIEEKLDGTFLRSTRKVEKFAARVNEFPSRHVRPVHCISVSDSNIRMSARENTPPPSLTPPLFLLHIRNADRLSRSSLFRNFATTFRFFFNLRSKIPSGYSSPSPEYTTRADPFKEGLDRRRGDSR